MKLNGYVPDTKVFDSMNLGNTNNVNDSTNSTGTDFLSTLKSKLDAVNDQQLNAEDQTQQFIKGDGPDIHQVMIATEEAKMSLELAVQMRNKLVDAYQELNRMQL
ncbi:MAG: flagellar hook-basal body complex protein FliE [Bacillota bacterium]|nr:flagellar hook-basal body complex protein FliE [Bacillota bacterium]